MPLLHLSVAVAVPHNDEVERAQIPGQVLLAVGHADAHSAQHKVPVHGQRLRPIPVVVAPHSEDRRSAFQLRQDVRLADVPGVENDVHPAEG